MPKKSKAIPVDRADWTFGDAVWWHFFVNGTRPGSSPGELGTPWAPERAAKAVGTSVRTLWNYVDNQHPPYDTVGLELALFGNSHLFDEWRAELRRLHGALRGQTQKSFKPESIHLPVVQYSVDYTSVPDTDVIDAEFEEVGSSASEKSGNDRKSPPFSTPTALKPDAASREHAETLDGRNKNVGRIVAVAMVALFGVYVCSKYKAGHQTVAAVNVVPAPPAPTAPPPARIEPTPAPAEPKLSSAPNQAAPVSPSPSPARTETSPPANLSRPAANPDPPPAPTREVPVLDASERARIEAEARAKVRADVRVQAEAKVKEEADRKAEAERQARLQAIRDDVERRAREQQASDLEFNEKLKITAKAEAESCARKLEGISVPGFTLNCDENLLGGTRLGSVPTGYDVPNLATCAAKCRPVAGCVGFAINMEGGSGGTYSCTLFGPTPKSYRARNYISGTR